MGPPVRSAEARLREAVAQVLDPAHNGADVTGLDHQILYAQLCCRVHHIVIVQLGGSQNQRTDPGGEEKLQQADAVQLRQHQVQDQNVRRRFQGQVQGFLAAPAGKKTVVSLKRVGERGAKLFGAVCDQNRYGLQMEFPPS